MKEEALARGHELPLPFGVGLVYNYLERDIEVSDVRVGIDSEPRSVSEFFDLGSNSKVNAALIKGDVWLLPFLNLYALLGYIHNESTSLGHVTIPRPPVLGGDIEFDVEIPTEIEGLVGGLGLTLAGGYKQLFVAGDVNYSQTDLGFDNSFSALVASVRTGWHGKVGDVPLRLWVGGSYWDTANTASSTVDIAGVGRVQFEADQGPRNPWNAVLGGSFVLDRRWECFAEYGFNLDDVKIFAAGITFRF